MLNTARHTTLAMLAAVLLGCMTAVWSVAPHAVRAVQGQAPRAVLESGAFKIIDYYNSLSHLPVLAPGASFSNNHAQLTRGATRCMVCGAYAARHRQASGGPGLRTIVLRNNRLTISGGFIEGSVHGAFGEGIADAIGNSLVLDDPRAYVRDARDDNAFDAAATGGVGITAADNSLLLLAGTVEGSLAGAYGQRLASGNSVMVHGGKVTGRVYGGSTYSGTASGNTIIMTGGEVGEELMGGYAALEGQAFGNKVVFSGGRVGGIVGSRTTDSPATENTVLINGGVVAPSAARGAPVPQSQVAVYGGYSAQAGAMRNTVILSGRASFADCVLYGGFSELSGKGVDVVSQNVLRLEADYRGELPQARNFEQFVVIGQHVRLPEGGYALHPSVRWLNNEGLLSFSGNCAARLDLATTFYMSSQGGIGVFAHIKGKGAKADMIALNRGALLLSPVRIKLMNPQALPVSAPLPVVVIDDPNSLRNFARHKAVQWLDKPRPAMDGAGRRYSIELYPRLGSDEQEIWYIEKRLRE